MDNQDHDLASQVWQRYAWLRDNGHHRFVQKADTCEQYFRGDQWSAEDLARLRAARRPALTINKILSTVSNIMGEQIFNRSEISFRPRGDSNADTAAVLTKLYKQVSDATQLDWKRSDMFADGIITSRGFIDIRMDYDKNIAGDIEVSKLNPKNVLVDMDAEDSDPDTWNEVFVTKWMTVDEVEVLYGKKFADELRAKNGTSSYPYGYDSIDFLRDRFGDEYNAASYGGMTDTAGVMRNVRVVERQYRKITRQRHFVEPKTGASRPVPDEWKEDRVQMVAQQMNLKIIKKLVRRIRWTVITDNIVLHDDWSPYKHFTVHPYFPYFRHGHTVGLVENLISPQELLNKTSSQELHIVNTTANSGWKVKTGSLTNMSIEELEQRGAETGLVIEVNELESVEKITPNATPTGLDRISYKAEDHIKTISGVTDTMQGNDREDVAAKAIDSKKKNSSTTLAKPLDSLVRTDYFIARSFIDLVQEFYTDERVMTIVHDDNTGETQQMTINQVGPDGQIINDLTIGEYDVVISSVPVRETLEDSQFEQAMAMKEAGIQIPDAFIIQSSRLLKKMDLVKQLQEASSSPQAQQQQQLQMAEMQATVAKLQAEVKQIEARAQLDVAKAGHQTELAQKEAQTPPEMPQQQPDPAVQQGIDTATAAHGMDLDQMKFQHEKGLKEQEMELKRQEAEHRMKLAERAAADKAAADRVAAQKSRTPA